ncbi:MAG TPA: hypothetical protein VLT84_13985 [Acidobacteriota bacterium]|nr:hypothetical protein [Acidobacteriota bacterium]
MRARACGSTASVLAFAWPAALAAALAAGPAAAGTEVAGTEAEAAGAGVTRVTYVSGGSVYLEAGRDQGVASGDSAEARRDGRRIAGLLIREVTSRRALCDTFAVVSMPQAGDEVRYKVRAVPAPAEAAADSGTAAPRIGAGDQGPRAHTSRTRTWRGRVAVGFLGVDPDVGGSVRQPTLDVRLDRIGRTLNLQADVRGRSTSAAGTTENEARVYRLAATLHDAASRRRVTVGRQVLSAAPGAAFFDGAVGELDRGAWTFGLFGGGEPAASTFEPSFDQIQAGAFARVRRSGEGRVWSGTLGFFDARYRGRSDRDAAFLDLFHAAPGRALFFNQQVDVNPGWKQALGDPSVSATSTFLFGRQAVGRALSFQAGFDNRRSVRLARDRESVETEFDDRYRRGAWSGATWDAARWLRVDGSGRWMSGVAQASRAYTGMILLRKPKRHDLSLRVRSTRTDEATDGWLHVAEGEWRFGGDRRLLLRTGREHWHDPNGITTTENRWHGAEIESGLGPKLYGFASGEWRGGDGGGSVQSQLGLAWYF